MEYIFSLTFSLYVFLGLKRVYYRQYIYGSCFCIHSASMGLFIGTFNSFTFKLIIDIYVLTAIFLIVSCRFCRCFSSLIYHGSVSPYNIYYKAGLVVLNSLNFCLSEKLFIFPSILNEILAGYCNLGCRFFPSNTLNISCHSLLGCRVSAE